MKVIHQKNVYYIDPEKMVYRGYVETTISRSVNEDVVEYLSSHLEIEEVRVVEEKMEIKPEYMENIPDVFLVRIPKQSTREQLCVRIRYALLPTNPYVMWHRKIGKDVRDSENNNSINVINNKSASDRTTAVDNNTTASTNFSAPNRHVEVVGLNFHGHMFPHVDCICDIELVYVVPNVEELRIVSSGVFHAMREEGGRLICIYKMRGRARDVGLCVGTYSEHDIFGENSPRKFYAPGRETDVGDTGSDLAALIRFIEGFCKTDKLKNLNVVFSGVDVACAHREEYAPEYSCITERENKMSTRISSHGDMLVCRDLVIMHHSMLPQSNSVEMAYVFKRVACEMLAHSVFRFLGLTAADGWIEHGFSGYLADMAYRSLLGNNEFLYRHKEERDYIVRNDVAEPPLLYTARPVVGYASYFFRTKSKLVFHCLEACLSTAFLEKIADELILRCNAGAGNSCVYHSTITATNHAAYSKSSTMAMTLMEIIKHQSGKDFSNFFDFYVFRPGLLNIRLKFQINKKKSEVRVEMSQTPTSILAGRNTRYTEPVVLRTQEIDGCFEHELVPDGENVFYYHTRAKKKKKEEEEEDVMSLLFMRADPKRQCLFGFYVQQPDYMYIEQLTDKNLFGQIEAVDALSHKPSGATCDSLERMMDNTHIFYKLRVRILYILRNIMVDGYVGLQRLIQYFVRTRCVSSSTVVKGNEFGLQSYFMQKHLVNAIAGTIVSGNEYAFLDKADQKYKSNYFAYERDGEDKGDGHRNNNASQEEHCQKNEQEKSPNMNHRKQKKNKIIDDDKITLFRKTYDLKDGVDTKVIIAFLEHILRFNDNSLSQFEDSWYLALVIHCLAFQVFNLIAIQASNKSNNMTDNYNNNNITNKYDNITNKSSNITDKYDNIINKSSNIADKYDNITNKSSNITDKYDNMTDNTADNLNISDIFSRCLAEIERFRVLDMVFASNNNIVTRACISAIIAFAAASFVIIDMNVLYALTEYPNLYSVRLVAIKGFFILYPDELPALLGRLSADTPFFLGLVLNLFLKYSAFWATNPLRRRDVAVRLRHLRLLHSCNLFLSHIIDSILVLAEKTPKTVDEHLRHAVADYCPEREKACRTAMLRTAKRILTLRVLLQPMRQIRTAILHADGTIRLRNVVINSVNTDKERGIRNIVRDRNTRNNIRNPINNIRNPINNIRNPINNIRNPINNIRSPINSIREDVSSTVARDNLVKSSNTRIPDDSITKKTLIDKLRIVRCYGCDHHKMHVRISRPNEEFYRNRVVRILTEKISQHFGCSMIDDFVEKWDKDLNGDTTSENPLTFRKIFEKYACQNFSDEFSTEYLGVLKIIRNGKLVSSETDKDNSNKDNSNKDNSNKDNSNKDNSNKDNGNKDNSNKDNSNKDNGNKDNSNNNSNKDNSNKDNGNKDNGKDNSKCNDIIRTMGNTGKLSLMVSDIEKTLIFIFSHANTKSKIYSAAKIIFNLVERLLFQCLHFQQYFCAMTDELRARCAQFVTALRANPDFAPFYSKVDCNEYKNYLLVVRVSVCIDDVISKLNLYTTYDAFIFDIERIVRNCLSYNRKGSEICLLAFRLADQINEFKRFISRAGIVLEKDTGVDRSGKNNHSLQNGKNDYNGQLSQNVQFNISPLEHPLSLCCTKEAIRNIVLAADPRNLLSDLISNLNSYKTWGCFENTLTNLKNNSSRYSTTGKYIINSVKEIKNALYYGFLIENNRIFMIID